MGQCGAERHGRLHKNLKNSFCTGAAPFVFNHRIPSLPCAAESDRQLPPVSADKRSGADFLLAPVLFLQAALLFGRSASVRPEQDRGAIQQHFSIKLSEIKIQLYFSVI